MIRLDQVGAPSASDGAVAVASGGRIVLAETLLAAGFPAYTSAAFPSTGSPGDAAVETDTGRLKYHNGASWVSVGFPRAQATAARPATSPNLPVDLPLDQTVTDSPWLTVDSGNSRLVVDVSGTYWVCAHVWATNVSAGGHLHYLMRLFVNNTLTASSYVLSATVGANNNSLITGTRAWPVYVITQLNAGDTIRVYLALMPGSSSARILQNPLNYAIELMAVRLDR